MGDNTDKKKLNTILYSQLQPWSTVGVQPCMEQVAGSPIPPRVGEFYKTPRPHPWRPTMGYENIELSPLPAQPITNQLVDNCYMPGGMATEPLRFPNLVTGFDRNPTHAARAALYTRYTPYEWTRNQMKLYNEADSNKHYSESIRQDNIRSMRETDERVKAGQQETGRRLGERLTDLTFWRDEISVELEKLLIEIKKMQECRKNLKTMLQALEGQLHIAQECLYHRESRKGNELVHDQVENFLLKEVEIMRNCERKLDTCMKKCVNQCNDGRAMKNVLEMELQNKEMALGIDKMCHQLNNYSRGLQYYGGIEKYDANITDAESWLDKSNTVVEKSKNERMKSCELHCDIGLAIEKVGHEMWESWEKTNTSLSQRIIELTEAKGKLQIFLHKIQDEIFAIEKNIELMQKAISDKSFSMKVAHTRLEARSHRPGFESCKDHAQKSLIKEVEWIHKTINDMHLNLQKFEAQHQQLLRTRSNLEEDLKNKMDGLFIDREKCISLRRSYPIAALVKF